MNPVGLPIWQMDTPVLWVDLDLLDSNIKIISNYIKEAGVGWRPHTKGIKIPAIAHKLIRAGALGITCAKLSEAEVMAMSGIKDILIANQVVGATKIKRLVALQKYADVMVAVDDLLNAQEISICAEEDGIKVRVLVEINIGMDRSGLEPGISAISIIEQVASLPGLIFSGLMGWEGHVCRIENPEEKKQKTEKAVDSLLDTAKLCQKSGLAVPIISCGGTGSYRITSNLPGVTEIQAGGGVLGDITYRRWGAGIKPALYILATITSHPAPKRVVIDAGRKTMNAEYSMPEVKDIPGVKLVKLSAEHGVLEIDPAVTNLRVGDKINLIVGYEDLTICLHDQLFGVRRNKVETVWDILGRGKLT